MNRKICKNLLLLLVIINIAGILTAQNKRDVPYTNELITFINAYFNHEITDKELLEDLFIKSIDSSKELDSEYKKLVHQGRCIYFYGLQLMVDYDISEISKTNLEDTSQAEDSNKKAAECFDAAIELAKKALKINKGSDAYCLIANGISANCTAKNTSYIINNGLKVCKYARKAIKEDSSNGTALYLNSCQNIYAPAPFCKINEGKEQMSLVFNSDNIHKEKFDNFYLMMGIGYASYRKKNFSEAKKWYEECLKIYPQNITVNKLMKKL